jgi:hypothetical protein
MIGLLLLKEASITCLADLRRESTEAVFFKDMKVGIDQVIALPSKRRKAGLSNWKKFSFRIPPFAYLLL